MKRLAFSDAEVRRFVADKSNGIGDNAELKLSAFVD